MRRERIEQHEARMRIKGKSHQPIFEYFLSHENENNLRGASQYVSSDVRVTGTPAATVAAVISVTIG
jgi:hypothetical protein